MAKLPKNNNPRFQIFFELWNIGHIGEGKGFIPKDLVGKITNNDFRDIGKYCNELSKMGFLEIKEEWNNRGKQNKLTKQNVFYLKWDIYAIEIIRLLSDEEFFISPDKRIINSVTEILKLKEVAEIYKRNYKIYPGKYFFKELFNPKLLDYKNVSPRLKKTIKLIEQFKKRNNKFEERIKEKYCSESKIPKDYLMKSFISKIE
jgi:hypothetical protein